MPSTKKLSMTLVVLLVAIAVLRLSESASASASAGSGSSTQMEPPSAGSSSPELLAGKKNLTGAGHHFAGYENNEKYNHGYGRGYPSGGYAKMSKPGYYKPKKSYGYQPHLVDDYICDFDASILVVTNSKNYGKSNKKTEKPAFDSNSQGNNNGQEEDYAMAHRLRCSAIAIRNDSDCSTCCQLAARLDRSISKDSIIGFIVDDDQIQHIENHNRKKRSSNTNSAPVVSNSPSINPKCVCCAPKHYNNYSNGYGYGKPRGGEARYGSGSYNSGYGYDGGYGRKPADYGNNYDGDYGSTEQTNYRPGNSAYGGGPRYGGNGGYGLPKGNGGY